MIIANGTIEAKIKADGGGLDPLTGYPVAAEAGTDVYSEPIPCQYKANSFNALARSNGESVTKASYTIFVEDMAFSAEQIRLRDKNGNIVGDYSVVQIEALEAVCQVRIMV